MPTNQGSSALTAAFKGSSEIVKIYIGTNAVFPNIDAPTVSTSAASSVAGTSMTLNGNLTDLGGAATGTVGFYFGTSSTYSLNTKYTVSTSATTGTFTYNATGLSAGTTYYINAFASNAGGETVASQVTQTTSFTPSLTVSHTSSYYGKTGSYSGPSMYTQFYDPSTTAYVTIDSYQNGNGVVSGISYYNGLAPYVGYNGCRGGYYGGYPSGKNYYNMWDYSSSQCNPQLRVCTNSTTRVFGGTYFQYQADMIGSELVTYPPTGSLTNRVFSVTGSAPTAYSIQQNQTSVMKSTVTAGAGQNCGCGGYIVHEFDL